MDSNDFISVNNILSEVTMMVDDVNFGKGMTQGFYVSGVEQALQEIALDTFFDKRSVDLPLPKNRQLPMPKGAFNIRMIYVFNGNCEPHSQSTQKVYYKRNFNNSPNGKGNFAQRRENDVNGDDTFFGGNLDPAYFNNTGGSMPYAAVQNGVIMFSSGCKGYSHVRLEYNGMGVECIGDEPILPRIMRNYFVDFVTERALRFLMARDRNYTSIWQITKDRLENPRNGSKREVRKRITSMNTWEREAYREYFSKHW